MNIDPSEPIEKLIEFGANQDYLWPVVNPSQTMLRDLSVASQSTKIALDSNGTVVYNAGYGSGNIDVWTDVLTLLDISAEAVKSTNPDEILMSSNKALRNCTTCLTLAKNICMTGAHGGKKGIHCQIADSLSS